MRILQVIPFFSPQMGGSAHVAYQTSRRLSQRGHEVTVVASDHATSHSRFEEASFRVVFLPSVMSRWGFYLTPGLLAWARAHVSGFDVIHMHTLRTFQNAVVRHFAVRSGVPYVLSAHGTLPVIVERKLAKRVYDLLFGRALLASASRLLAVSRVEAEQYREAGVEEERIRVIYNGLDLEEFAHLPARGTFRRRHGIAEETRVVLFLGRLHRRKGIDHLLEAFARILGQEEDAVLIIAGPDEGELSHLQALARHLGLDEGVRFTGPLYGEDKLAAYVDADVVACPAVHEIFGLVPFEALLCGTPVIVTDDCGSGQMVGEAQAGYIVRYGDVDALTDALFRAVRSRQEALRMVRAGQSYTRELLGWDCMVGDLEKVYAEVAGGSGSMTGGYSLAKAGRQAADQGGSVGLDKKTALQEAVGRIVSKDVQ